MGPEYSISGWGDRRFDQEAEKLRALIASFSKSRSACMISRSGRSLHIEPSLPIAFAIQAGVSD